MPQQTDIRVERNGNKRWLVVDARPEQVGEDCATFGSRQDLSSRLRTLYWHRGDGLGGEATFPLGTLETFWQVVPGLYSAGRDGFGPALSGEIDPAPPRFTSPTCPSNSGKHQQY